MRQLQAADKVPSKSDIWKFAQKSESHVSTRYAGVKGAQPNETHLPVDSDGFPWKTAVFSRRGRADC